MTETCFAYETDVIFARGDLALVVEFENMHSKFGNTELNDSFFVYYNCTLQN